MEDFFNGRRPGKARGKGGKGRAGAWRDAWQTRMIEAVRCFASFASAVARGAKQGACCAMSMSRIGGGAEADLASELRGVSTMDDYEMLSAIEELAVRIDSDTDALARLIANVAEDEVLSAFVSVSAIVEAPATRPARFRVVDAGLNCGRTWGYGEVVFANEMGCAVTFTWIRPAPSQPRVVESYDALTAIRNEVLFRFAFLYRLRDADNKATVVCAAATSSSSSSSTVGV